LWQTFPAGLPFPECTTNAWRHSSVERPTNTWRHSSPRWRQLKYDVLNIILIDMQ